MQPESRLVFAIAAEDRGHYEAVTRLTDRKIAEECPWTAEILEHVRLWLGEGDRKWASITSARKVARERGLKLHGGFGAEPGGLKAQDCRAQLIVWKDSHRAERIDAAFLVRDLDRKEGRLEAMRFVLGDAWPFAVVAVWCQPEVEAWAIACFVAKNKAGEERLDQVRKRISFCPVAEPERLHSTVRNSDRDAKKIAEELFGGDRERSLSWLELPFETLRQRGANIGLADLIDQLDEKIVPLLRQSFRPTSPA
jgi:hypothetical protein